MARADTSAYYRQFQVVAILMADMNGRVMLLILVIDIPLCCHPLHLLYAVKGVRCFCLTYIKYVTHEWLSISFPQWKEKLFISHELF
jgi:hypothetical protein